MILGEVAAADSTAAELASQLVAELYESVPSAPNAQARRCRLRAKRDAYGRRLIDSECLPHLPPGPTRERAQAYNEALARKEQIIERGAGIAMQELRDHLANLAKDPDFQAAVDYSCRSLLPRYLNNCGENEREFTQAERGLYAYAVKCFSKANPFYTFATVTLTLPGANGTTSVEPFCEVVLDTSMILAIEQRLLREGADDSRRLLFFAAHIDEGELFRFLTSRVSELRVVTLKSSPLLRRALSFCSASAPCRSLAECVGELASAFPQVGSERARAYLRGLIEAGIAIEYLVRDFDDFRPDLSAADERTRERVKTMQDMHLGRFQIRDWPGIRERLRSLETTPSDRPSYYINLYKPRPADRERRLVEVLEKDLTALKPLFLRSNNFSERGRVIRRFLAARAKRRPEGVPFLSILQDFLRAPDEAIGAYSSAPPIESPARLSPSSSNRGRLHTLSGVLSSEQLRMLNGSCQPDMERRLCFNGPLDCENGTFYPTNVFPGGGRYLSRYLLRDFCSPMLDEGSASGIMDVQLVVPFKGNRTYVKTAYSAGCGFDARYRHRFERWIDPSDIIVRSQEEQISYIHLPSGQEMRFHFRGFLLAECLGAEYQLLLAHHADFFGNPFEPDASWVHGAGDQIERLAALDFGKICLRREQWRVGSSLLATWLDGDDIIRDAIRMRGWIHDQTGQECDEWYYRVHSRPQRVVRPRYLDLRNPLSLQVLRREVRRQDKEGSVTLARMEPSGPGLFHENGQTFATEVMIEV